LDGYRGGNRRGLPAGDRDARAKGNRVLTIDYDRFQVNEGDTFLDLGCGAGRHTFEALRRGADVVALDQNADDLRDVELMVTAMAEAGEIKPPEGPVTLLGDALALPFPDGHFDRVLAS
jgi:ubiquinone/menaquinone biosynthesis C-methylase UbiE